ncbi:MAG: hypothetical protein IJA30_01950 [Bacilli bacterium]|nr:hypothetical protein [Bacilli bacterium]
MQIQKGLVKYKDRSDIVCTYGLTEEGRQYYFLDNTSMTNGNIIASTVLVEAIDPVAVASSVGVIDSNGAVVIPFENKSIKPIADGLLLVEVANSTTPSVVEANSLRSDPLAATKLVTTPATIKDKMNVKMGAEGRFIFNDQFSEATICDYSGNNILDNQYFSFIAIKNNETLYLSKNTIDSPVMEYSLRDRMFIAQAEEPAAPLDVQNTEVTQETIDGAMNAEEKIVGFNPDDITAKDFESVADGMPVEEPLSVDPSVVDPNAPVVPADVIPAEDAAPAEENVSEENETIEDSNIEEPLSVIPDAVATEETTAENTEENTELDEPLQLDESLLNNENTETVTENNVESVSEPEPVVPDTEVENPVEETPTEEVQTTEDTVSEEVAPVEENTEVALDNPLTEEVKSEVEETPVNEVTSDDKLAFDFGDDINYSEVENETPAVEVEESVEDVVNEFKNDLFDTDLNNDIFAESTLQADKIDIDESYNDFSYRVGAPKDTIIEDVASTMSNLIRQNKSQKQTIEAYESKMEQAADAYKKVVDKARSQLRDVEVLKNKLKNYETIVTKLEAKIQVLENKVYDQDKVIASQTRELDSLRPQVEGKEELARILADAQSLLDQSI